MKKMVIGVLALAFLAVEVQAQISTNEIVNETEDNTSPTVVWGAARNVSGGENEFRVIQNAEDGNPLGNPIGDADSSSDSSASNDVSEDSSETEPQKVDEPKNEIKPIVQTTPQGIEKPWQEPLPQPSDQIENELYQSGNDIIDVQAYPIKDVSTVTEPNIQPTIINQ